MIFFSDFPAVISKFTTWNSYHYLCTVTFQQENEVNSYQCPAGVEDPAGIMSEFLYGKSSNLLHRNIWGRSSESSDAYQAMTYILWSSDFCLIS